MPNRHLAPIGAAVALVALAAAGPAPAQQQFRLEASEVPAEQTAAAVVDPEWEAPRTSWGHPDLSGIWTTDDMRSVPRERPEELGTRESLTPDEFAERAAEDAEERRRVLAESSYSPTSVGSRTFGYTSLVVDPPDGQIPEMTEAGQARAQPSDRGSYGTGPFHTFEDLHLYDRCITRGVLGSILPVIYGNGLRIVQNPQSVAISYEMLAETRIVKLDGRPHAQDNMRQYLGTSRGYFDGDTLVVETQNLTDRTSIGGNGIGTPHSERMTITERFTRVDPEMIEYVATVEDPIAYTEPFTFRMMLTSQPGYEIFEYACHEGNTAVSSALGGEREYERQVAEAIARGEEPPERLASQPFLGGLPDDDSAFINVNEGEHRDE